MLTDGTCGLFRLNISFAVSEVSSSIKRIPPIPDNSVPCLFIIRIMGEGLVVRYETL